jgi:hypothetical protein
MVAVAACGGSAASAKTFPCPKDPHEPCKGPIEVSTGYSGYKEGPSWEIKITLGPSHQISQGNERSGGDIREVVQRQASWHSVPSVEIVAVFILHRPAHGPRFRYQKVASGRHGGHTTLTDVVSPSTGADVLIIQGRRIKGIPTGHHKPTRCTVIGAPCLGPLHSFYAFNGLKDGDTNQLPAHIEPEEPAGTDPQGHPLVKRRFLWHSAAGVKLVAAFEVTGTRSFHVRRLPTGPYSGEATITTATSPTSHMLLEIPILLLEGTRTR